MPRQSNYGRQSICRRAIQSSGWHWRGVTPSWAGRRCLELVAAAEESHPIDAAVVKAVYYWNAKNVAEAARWMERFFTLLEDDPWVISAISDGAFDLSVDIAKVDRDAAERFYSLVSRPFASRRFHYLRLLTRVLLGEQLGPEKVVEALADLEPDVTWTHEVLEPRAKAYAALNHPYASRAEREWQWFQEHRIPDDDASSNK